MDANQTVESVQAAGKGGWSWAAHLGVVVLLAAMFPTWGLSIFLSPVTIALSPIAWFRSEHEGVFWLGVASNVLLALMCIGFLAESS